jgi:hypothetical protein
VLIVGCRLQTKSDSPEVVVCVEDAPDLKVKAAVVEDGTNQGLFTGWLSERLSAISQTLLNQDKPDVKALRAIVDEVEKETQKLSGGVWKASKAERTAVLERMKGVHDLLRGCHEALAKIAVGTLDRDSKARLLNQAYQRRLGMCVDHHPSLSSPLSEPTHL